MAKKKGGKKKGKGGKKKGAAKPLTMAVGSILDKPSSFAQWKQAPKIVPPPQHRSAPTLLQQPRGNGQLSYRPPPQLTQLPITIVRAASAGNTAAIISWVTAAGPMTQGAAVERTNLRWDSPTGAMRQVTLLMLSSICGHEHLVEALLRRGADPDLIDAHGRTALMHASIQGRHTAVQKLLQAGCRTDIRARMSESIDAKDGSAIDFAVAHGFALCAKLIRTHDACCAGAPPTQVDPEVVEAAMRGDIEQVVAWLECGGHVDAEHRAPTGVQAGAPAGAAPPAGTAPAGAAGAVPAGAVPVGAPAEAPASGGGPATLLMIASEYGHAKLVDVLIEYGAATDVTRATDGATPMMIAAYAGHRDVVRRLLRPKPPSSSGGGGMLFGGVGGGSPSRPSSAPQHHRTPPALIASAPAADIPEIHMEFRMREMKRSAKQTWMSDD